MKTATSNGIHRFTRGQECPVCQGTDDDDRGQGRRCHGYVSSDRKFIFCAREEHAGKARFDAGPGCYRHTAKGPCPCGKEHAPADPKPARGRNGFGEIDKVYRYHDLDGSVPFEVVRFKNPKDFRQRQPVPGGKPVWNLKGVKTILYQRPLLMNADPADPVFVVEGEKDVDNLGARGLIATCNPMGAKKWRDHYSEDLRDRHVIILPDNDQDGRDHAQQVARSLQGKAASVKVVPLPGLPEKGDASDFLARGGTVDQLQELARKAPEWKPTAAPPPPAPDRLPHAVGNEGPEDPHRLARLFMAGRCSHGKSATLIFHRGQFWQWDGSCYHPIEVEELGAGLTSSTKAEFDRFNKIEIAEWEARGKKDRAGRPSAAPETRKVTRILLANVEQALKGMGVVSGRIDPPAWLVDNPPFDAREVIPCRNGLLHIPSFLEGRSALQAPTPSYFGCHSLDFDFDPNAAIPETWTSTLESNFAHDLESIPALQQWMGYLLTSDTSQQKIGMLIGPTRCGKGTIARVITALIGRKNVATPSMAEFGMEFGLQELIGKPLVIVGDARVSRKQDPQMAVERFLAISGEDSVQIDRKYLQPWTGRLPSRLMILSNIVPRLPDSSRALPGRMLALRFIKSWKGQEDTRLEAKLNAELPGILLWAMEGWRQLQERGSFLQPKTGQSIIDEMAALGSPIGTFVEDVCERGPTLSIPTKELFVRWKDWCESINIRPGSDAEFGQNLRAFDASIVRTRPRDDDGTREYHYEGIGINGKPF
jgi:putative DNA primase/helicase